MPIRIISDLVGTMQSYFRIGVNKIVNIGGVLTAQTNAGASSPIASSEVQLKGTTNKLVLQPTVGMGADLTLTFPATDGATNQALATNGAGVLSFITVATGANAVKAEDQAIAFGSTSPVTIVTLPAGATVQKVIAEVETAFDGTPSLSVGITGTPSKYMNATDIDLATLGTYEVEPMVEEAGSVSPIVTYAAGGASVGLARITVQWVLPG